MSLNSEQLPFVMAPATRQRLQARHDELVAKQIAHGHALGDSVESAQDWHDNSARDALMVEDDLLEQQIKLYSTALINAIVVEPVNNSNEVVLGSTVKVRFSGEEEEEIFTILGPFDNETDPTWISALSPVGQALLGRSVGEKITTSTGIEITITTILNGER